MLDYFIPLHPKVVHFPVALFVSALVFDVLSLVLRKEILHKTAVNMYIFAALTTPIVVRTGLWEEDRLHLNHPVLNQHELFALRTMWVSLISLPLLWLIKIKIPQYFRLLFLILLIGTVTLVGLTAHNGGRLVYEYAAGVEK